MRVAIIGAGIAGLTAAHELATRGEAVTVYEAAEYAGGLSSGFRDERWDWPLERFYHHLFTSDTAIRRLVATIGYGDQLVFRRQLTGQWWRGRPYPVQGGIDALRLRLGPLAAAVTVPDVAATTMSLLLFPGLPLVHRLRMGMVSAYLKYALRDWRPLERATAADWTRRAMGETAYRAFIYPLLEGKFGPHADEVNMAWLWARLKTRSFQLGYFEGGFQGFVDALLAHVRDEGARVHLGAPVAGLVRLPDGRWRVGSTALPPEEYDGVIFTGSPEGLRRLVPDLPEEYLGRIARLRSMGAVVMTIALRRPLTNGFYWINMPKDEFPFLALVEHTNFIAPERYGGDHLIYCGDYLDPSHEYFRLSPEDLLERFLPALQKVNVHFDRSWVRAFWLHREPYAQPIVPVDHSRDVPALTTPLPGLYWASMSQVYPWDRGTNYAVAAGQDVAQAVLASAAAPRASLAAP